MSFSFLEIPALERDGRQFPRYKAIHAMGEIADGDAQQLELLMSKAGRDEYGNVRVYLDSVGGSVDEAMQIVRVFDRHEVTAVVPSGAACLSACASVLFVSARIHFMEEGDGVLGFHTCRVAGVYPSAPCNSAIGENAVHHGTGFGSLLRWMADRPRDEDDLVRLNWRDATISGLIGPPTYDPTLAYPSFDCKTARHVTDKLICSNPRLARYERSFFLSMLAYSDLAGASTVKAMRSFQLTSGEIKARCGAGIACLMEEYAYERRKVRLAVAQIELNNILKRVADTDDANRVRFFFQQCVDATECGRPPLLDASYEFFATNLGIYYAKRAASLKGDNIDTPDAQWGRGESDCQIARLCDPKVQVGELADKIDRLIKDLDSP